MASKILPQPLLALPRKNLTSQYPPINWRIFCTTRVPPTRVVMGCVKRLPSLVARATGGDNEGQGVVDNAEEVVEESAESLAEGENVDEDVAEGEEKSPKKPRAKLGEIMGILNKRAVEIAENVRPVPDIRTGDVVEIKLEVPENKRRLSVYKGIVISKQNAGIHTTIRIRRIIAGIGVEIVFPLYSPNIKELRVLSHRKVRRARLYYLRDKLPRLSTFK